MPEPSRFLQGSFAPVTEEVTAYDLPITGTLPAELTGRYLRNGPNPLGLDDPNYHWFLGAGMVHGVRLRDGKAEWYRNRWVRSKAVAAAHFQEWPAGPVFENMDFAANTHIIFHGGRTLATVEAGPRPYELTYELDTVGPSDFGGTLPGGFAAHTKLDHATGELHAIAYFWAWDHVQHVVVDATGKVIRTTDVPIPDGPMMHDFALTRTYVVLLDLPVTFSLDAVAAGRNCPTSGIPATSHGSACCRATAAAGCAGSRSTRAGSSTASTPTTPTTARSSSTCASTPTRSTPPRCGRRTDR